MTTEKTRRRLPRRVREREIVDAALRVFAQRGYHAAVVDEIADLAGISKPMVYLYLGSKENLFVACVRQAAEALVTAFRQAADSGDQPQLRLWRGLSAFFAFVAEHRDSWVILHRQTPEQSEAIAEELERARESVMAEVTDLVRRGIDEGGADARLGPADADFVASALVGAADSLTDWMERNPQETPERVALRLMNMIWVGMRDVLGGEMWSPPGDSVG
ncbi:TetR/AcrR family transcriptional regulator [Streptomyces triticirhizae]|uniref:TetR/AcrR family transcriptional regulator n=1 Tax=Streptomyces triticirhizae TaxID=2483353 RepID=A0A3M2LX05_9ACTN|nr:TetR/AcrR family transcriptional regulator [Streptomyces triticirhizae]RMI40555.1 TetR/AcrR family transcriptional regulator [Streptomyces triticirhizae]